MGHVAGVLRFPDAAPIARAEITLGLELQIEAADPETYVSTGMVYAPKIGVQEAQRTRTDADGNYRYENVPAGCHEFLATTLDCESCDINMHFFAEGVEVRDGEETSFESTLREWRSAPPVEIENPFPKTLQHEGLLLRRVHIASSLTSNEGPHKEISRVQHKNSAPRLQEFRLWWLDEADHAPRPHVVA